MYDCRDFFTENGCMKLKGESSKVEGERRRKFEAPFLGRNRLCKDKKYGSNNKCLIG